MKLLLWTSVLLAAVWAAYWGADKLSDPLQKLRMQWGLSEAAGAAFIALATASPEIGTNTVSAFQGLADIGLGNLLGSNIISVPAIVTVAYLASQTRSANQNQHSEELNSDEEEDFSRPNTPQLNVLSSWTELRVKPEALTVQAIPYLIAIALVAALTVPEPWRGLQPIDGWIMGVAYLIYVGQAILRGRQEGQTVRWRKGELGVALGGILALAIGAYFVVAATERIVTILGISELIGGLFITSTLSIAPEVFATWSVARSGQMTAATTSVIADNTATMTLAFFPLALVGIPIENFALFSVNLGFVALLAALYSAFIQWGKRKYSFELWEVATLIVVYFIYLAIVLIGILKVFT
ncbi:MAG: sodium/calcium exchanger protein [Cyanobacteriota bacterium]|nr:sodium/calcium exchanger protein [Cyanobacteriota bacterium]